MPLTLAEAVGRAQGLLDFVVPNGFSNVPQVSNVFLNTFPIAPHFVPYALSDVVILEPT
jgi:hypothetical protein